MGNQQTSGGAEKQLLSFDTIDQQQESVKSSKSAGNSELVEPTVEAILNLPDFRPVLHERARSLQGVLQNWGSEKDAIPNADPYAVKKLSSALGKGLRIRTEEAIQKQSEIYEELSLLQAETQDSLRNVHKHQTHFAKNAKLLHQTELVHSTISEICESMRSCTQKAARLQTEIDLLITAKSESTEESDTHGEELK